MIYLTADIHGQVDIGKITMKKWPIQKQLTRDDYLIVCGDFGLIWKNDKTYQYLLDFYTSRNYMLLFCEGNHALVFDTDLLTNQGWRNIVDCYNDPNIVLANFDINTREIYFDKPSARYRNYHKNMIKISSTRIEQIVDLNHSVVVDNKWIPAEKLLNQAIYTKQIPICGSLNLSTLDKCINISDDMIRLIVWLVCDGTVVDYSTYVCKSERHSKKCRIQFKLSKQRKIDALSNLLNKLNIKFSLLPATKSKGNILQPYYIRFYGDNARMLWNLVNKVKQFPEWFKYFNQQQFQVFLDELSITDGHKRNNDYITWGSTNKNDIDLVQELCIYNNWQSYYKLRSRNTQSFKTSKPIYYMTITQSVPKGKLTIEQIEYNNYTYCFTTPRGTLITRHNGKVAFTGNSNHAWLNTFPVIQWHGGSAHSIAENIIHLMRGEVYDIDGFKFLSIGGAKSIDKAYRIPYIDWWPEEEVSQAEIQHTLDNLDKHKWLVDYVITHAAPRTILRDIFPSEPHLSGKSSTEKFLEYIQQELTFKQWYFGHYHIDRDFGKYHCLYNRVVPLIIE